MMRIDHFMKCFCLALVAFLSLLTTALSADEPTVADADIEALVAQLVSPNPEPLRRNSPTATYPAGYDRNAQKLVDHARLKLSDLGIRAFPILIKYLDDKRYSSTQDSGAVDENWTVGRTCKIVLTCHLQPYDSRIFAADTGGEPSIRYRPTYSAAFTGSSKAAKQWWEASKEKSLHDLQLEAVEWVVAEQAKDPEKYSNKDRKYMDGVRRKLLATDKPLKPSSPPIAK
jgi:hypothetical protein